VGAGSGDDVGRLGLGPGLLVVKVTIPAEKFWHAAQARATAAVTLGETVGYRMSA